MKINIKNISIKSICATLFISLFLSCNNGVIEELQKEKTFLSSLMDVGRSAENTFYSFMSLISDTLGFRVTADKSKKDVGEHFKKLAEGIDQAIKELLPIADKTIQSDEQSGKEENLSRLNVKVQEAKVTLEKLKGHISSLESIGDTSKVGEVGGSQQGAKPADEELKKAYNALKGIVEIARAQQVDEPKKNDLVIIDTSKIGGTTPEHGARVLATVADAGQEAGSGAAKIVSAVSGEAILAAIVSSQ
ncbi:Variable major outer membrane lipoprotein (plasmid) [Borrelia coriaceae ATCC 43381]|uniref:Variable large protein n=1 Tax=Borrelia coriaceae ATCC 43381 TaxID=1408429 RepID=W5SX83_9SPIR|nr:Variable major outer membrane lipoprotein [Borrelia coriaceae ATCC 43381]